MTERIPARLIPLPSTQSAGEAEVRAASAFLAVLSIVRPFSKSLLDALGASTAAKAQVRTYIEVPFEDAGKDLRPDGLIEVVFGSRSWSALVEVKTGPNRLDKSQVESYLGIARSNGFDAVITISNEIAPGPDSHPTGLRVRSNSKVTLHHWSWTRLLTTAVLEYEHRDSVDDAEQRWILLELIRYLRDDRSGALDFADMGEHWTAIRDGARNGVLTKRTDGVTDIATRWDQLTVYSGLVLGMRIGELVNPQLSKAHRDSPARRLADLVDGLCATGTLSARLRVPGAAGDIDLIANLQASQIAASVDLAAPSTMKDKGRIGWLLRQLADAHADTVVESWVPYGKEPAASATLGVARDDKARACLLDPSGREIAKFRVVLRAPMGKVRKSGGRNEGFSESVVSLVERFYERIVQNLTPYQQPAPKASVQEPPNDRADAAIGYVHQGTNDV